MKKKPRIDYGYIDLWYMAIKMIYILIKHRQRNWGHRQNRFSVTPTFPILPTQLHFLCQQFWIACILQTQLYCLPMHCCPSTVSMVSVTERWAYWILLASESSQCPACSVDRVLSQSTVLISNSKDTLSRPIQCHTYQYPPPRISVL